MRTRKIGWWFTMAALAAVSAPAKATVHVVALTPKLASPQPIGAIVDWTAKATDTNPGPLTFQFNVAPRNRALATVKQFNAGALSGSAWESLAFA